MNKIELDNRITEYINIVRPTCLYGFSLLITADEILILVHDLFCIIPANICNKCA